MRQYHQLSTQTFVDEAQKAELRQLRKQMAKRNFKSFMLFGFSIAVFLLAMFAVFQMPNWFPGVSSWLEQTGVLTSASS